MKSIAQWIDKLIDRMIDRMAKSVMDEKLVVSKDSDHK